jgi:hypothetical protein
MPSSDEVDAWFRDLDHPLKKAMLESARSSWAPIVV